MINTLQMDICTRRTWRDDDEVLKRRAERDYYNYAEEDF